jgi:large subunit ribosomal protein L15e
MYRYITDRWQKILFERSEELKEKLIKWRRGPSITRVEKPTRLDRARRLGYKAKQGFVIVRVRVSKGGMRLPRPRSGRRQKRMGVLKRKGNVNSKQVAINRAKEKYPNLYPMGVYYLAEDGRYRWYEVVMVDTSHPAIKADQELRKRLPK